MYVTELDKFIVKLKHLWKSGHDARFNVETHAGQAWVSLHVKLGNVQDHHPQHHQEQPHHHRRRDGPSRQRRRARRAAARKLAAEANEDESESCENNTKVTPEETTDVDAVKALAENEDLSIEEMEAEVAEEATSNELPLDDDGLIEQSVETDPVTTQDLMDFLKKSEEERKIQMKRILMPR